MKKSTYYTLLIACMVAACSPENTKNNLIDITSKFDNKSGYKDIVLAITNTTENDSFFVYKAEGLYKGDTVGLQVALRKGIKAGIVNGDMKNVFLHNSIILSSIGSQSDKLLSSLASLYGETKPTKAMRKDKVSLTCANLNDQDINYTNGEHRFKLFMETGEDSNELYINFDFGNKLIYLNEKDVEYRAGVLEFLGTAE